MDLLDRAEEAFAHSEFFVRYMPTMSLADGRCVGGEALVRWNSRGDEIPPLEFIPCFENTPLSGRITTWVVQTVGRELGAWLRETPDAHLAINVAPELIGRGGLRRALEAAGLQAVRSQLIMEITERGVPDERAIATLNAIAHENTLAIDDFGTGELNLADLARLPANIVKMDKSFVDEIRPEHPVPKIARGLAAFARAIGVEVIAEGVETAHQAGVLSGLGVQMAQGWLFSKPLEAEAFKAFFRAHRGGGPALARRADRLVRDAT